MGKWPSSGGSAYFPGPDATANYTITVGATAPTVRHMNFAFGGYVISGGTINPSAAADTITVAAGKTATINSVIGVAASASITKSGAGTLILGGANTYAGTTTVSAGTLEIGGTAGRLSGGLNIATPAGTGGAVFRRTVAQSNVTGAGRLTVEAGTLTLSNSSAYTGPITVNGGTLEVTSALGAGTVAVGGSGTLLLNVTGAQTFSRSVTGGGTFEKSGTGTLTLTAATGVASSTVKVSGGKLDGTVPVGAMGATITASAGGTLAGKSYTGAVTVSAGGILEDTSAAAMAITGTLTMSGAAQVNLSINSAAKTTPRITVSGALALGAAATLNITTPLTASHVGTYEIITAGASTSPGNFNKILVEGGESGAYDLSTAFAGGKLTLKIDPKTQFTISNPLRVTAVHFVSATASGSSVDVTVSGFNDLRSYNTTSGDPRIDGVYIWYKPGAAAADEKDTTAQGGRVRIVPPSFPTGNSETFRITVKGADALYFFNANVYWIDGGAPVLKPMSPAMSEYLGDPKKAVEANGLRIEVTNYTSTVSGVNFDLTVTGQDAPGLSAGSEYRPGVDSVGVWFKRNGGGEPRLSNNNNSLTATNAGANDIKVFSLAGLLSDGKLSWNAPAVTGGHVDTFYFAVAPRWKGAGVDSIARPLFVTSVRVADPTNPLPNNPYVLTGAQNESRQRWAAIRVEKTDDSVNEHARSVRIELSLTLSMADVLYSKDYSLSEVDAGLSFDVSSDSFIGAERDVYWRVTVIGEYGEKEKTGTFQVGRARPQQPENVVAEPIGKGYMRLSWDQITTAYDVGNIDSSKIIIAYSKSALSRDIDILNLPDTVMLPASRISADVGGLEPETNYWFAVALYDVVDQSKPAWNLASVATVIQQNSGAANIVPNILDIVEASFDTISMSFTVNYVLTRASEGLPFSYRVTLGSDTVLVPEGPLSLPATVSDSGAAGTFSTLSLGDAVMFDTTYRIAIFTVDADNNPAAGRSMRDVRVGPFSSQTVIVAYNGTAYVDNRRFGVSAAGWSEGMATVSCTTKVVSSAAGLGQANFEYLGASGYKYSFSAGGFNTILPEFTIRMAVEEGYNVDSVMIYRWTGSFWEVVYDTKCENGYCVGTAGDSLKNDTASTYRLLINKAGPIVNRLSSNNDDPVSMNSSIVEEFSVISNIGNARITLMCAPANNPDRLTPVEPSSPLMKGKTQTPRYIIINDIVRSSANYGVLSYLIVSDGRITDTINYSRRVESFVYNGFQVTPPDDPRSIWLPFAAQVKVDAKQVKNALKSKLFSEDDEFAFYDTLFRLFRWYPNADNAKSDRKWVEYNGDNDNVFDMEPGRLMWLKTSETKSFDFGSATSISLVDTFKIALPSKEWTDFVLPFRFDICVGDVLTATGAPIELYRWKEMEKGKNKQKYYGADALALVATDSSTLLRGGADPFTVYNPGNTEIFLRIPPRPAFMSRHRMSKRLAKQADGEPAASDGLWYYTIQAGTENTPELGGVMVGYSAAKRTFAVPPSFLNESVAIVDDDGRGSIGHYFGPDLSGGRTLKLRFYNDDKQKTTFTFSARPSGFVPAGTQVTFVNATTGQDLATRGSEYAIAVSGMSHEDVYMVIGGGEYRNKVGAGAPASKFTVSPISVNQAARSARVKFYIPFAGIDRVEVSVYDIKGRMVWKNMQAVRPSSWNTMEWNSRQSRNGAVSAGLYIVRVKAMDARGRTTAVENRRLTFAR